MVQWSRLKYPLVVLSFLNIGVFTFAQQSKKYSVQPKNTILFSPLNALDIINPTLQLGYERMLTKQLAWQVEGATLLHHSIPTAIIDIARGQKVSECPSGHKGYQLRTEVKYFLIQKRKIALYSSMEAFYLDNKTMTRGVFSVTDPDLEFLSLVAPNANTYDRFFYNQKIKYGLNMKCGFKFFPHWTGFVMETYLGLGLARRTNRHLNSVNMEHVMLYNSLPLQLPEGNRWLLNIPFNLKLGYRF